MVRPSERLRRVAGLRLREIAGAAIPPQSVTHVRNVLRGQRDPDLRLLEAWRRLRVEERAREQALIVLAELQADGDGNTGARR